MSSWISEKDRAILRELANRQAECHASPAMQQTIADWKAHGDFRGRRPMVMLEMNTFEEEILPGRLRCEGRRRAGWKRIFTAGCCPASCSATTTWCPAISRFSGAPIFSPSRHRCRPISRGTRRDVPSAAILTRSSTTWPPICPGWASRPGASTGTTRSSGWSWRRMPSAISSRCVSRWAA